MGDGGVTEPPETPEEPRRETHSQTLPANTAQSGRCPRNAGRVGKTYRKQNYEANNEMWSLRINT